MKRFLELLEDVMDATGTRFASKTMDSLVDLLLMRRASSAHCAEALLSEAADALSRRDISDLLDEEDPSADSDAATVLMLVLRAERRLRQIDEALDRAANGTYGYCISCRGHIPLQRLRALPAAASCVDCSRHSSHRVGDLVYAGGGP